MFRNATLLAWPAQKSSDSYALSDLFYESHSMKQQSFPDLAADGLKRTIYVFVRTDISVEQQMVQAAHAAAEAARLYYQPDHGIASLIILAVPNRQALYRAATQVEALGIAYELFFEPDWDMGHSALGTRPLLDTERPLLRGWPLWKLKTAQASPQGVSA